MENEITERFLELNRKKRELDEIIGEYLTHGEKTPENREYMKEVYRKSTQVDDDLKSCKDALQFFSDS